MAREAEEEADGAGGGGHIRRTGHQEANDARREEIATIAGAVPRFPLLLLLPSQSMCHHASRRQSYVCQPKPVSESGRRLA